MSATVFLSTTNTEPYAPVDEDIINNTVTIDQVVDVNTVETTAYLYCVVTDGVYDRLDIKVENENSSGSSLYISPTDGVGNPTHWGKLITLENIDATYDHSVTQLQYKWIVVNNIYIVKRLHVSGNINIYEV